MENLFRLGDDEELSAKTGVKETTREAAVYPHPTNDKIKFWDLPGIETTNEYSSEFKSRFGQSSFAASRSEGEERRTCPKRTRNYPDLETYCKKVGLHKYDTFLIFTANRFTANDLLLAQRVKSMQKSFFLIRTKIDQDYQNERRKKGFNEDEMLSTIRADCLDNLDNLRDGDEVVFLISNHYPKKWDFDRLTQAIIDMLPLRQRECFTLSFGVLTSFPSNILKRKVELLRGRIWMVAAASAAGAVVLLPGLSVALDFALLTSEVNMYKTQLGLPDEGSLNFEAMTPENQEVIRQFCLASAKQLAPLIASCQASASSEKFTHFIPFLSLAIAGGMSFSSTYCFLNQCLNKMEKSALSFLDEVTETAVHDFDTDKHD